MFASHTDLACLSPKRVALLIGVLSLAFLSGCGSQQVTPKAPVQTTASKSPGLIRSLERTPREALPLGSLEDVEVLRIAVVSDLNGRYGSTDYSDNVHKAVERLKTMRPDVILSAGDMVAGQKRGLDYDAMWEAFHLAVSDPLAEAGLPFAVSPGNHDASAYEPFEEERERYKAAWEGRKPDLNYVDDEHFPFRYAFERDGALFVALDITRAEPMEEEQKEWLDKVLADNADLENKIVFGHVPIYPFAERKRTDVMDDPELEDLLNRHEVTLFVSGHHQAYYPGRRGELRMVGTGCLGGGVRKLLGTEQRSVRTIVLIEIDKYGVRRVDGLHGNRFDTLVARENLPRHLGNQQQRITRDDIGNPQYIAERMQKMQADGLQVASVFDVPAPILDADNPTLVASTEPVRPQMPLAVATARAEEIALNPSAGSPGELTAALDGAVTEVSGFGARGLVADVSGSSETSARKSIEREPRARTQGKDPGADREPPAKTTTTSRKQTREKTASAGELVVTAEFGRKSGGRVTAAVRGLGKVDGALEQWEYEPLVPQTQVVAMGGDVHGRAWADPSLALTTVVPLPPLDLAAVLSQVVDTTAQRVSVGALDGRDQVVNTQRAISRGGSGDTGMPPFVETVH